MQRVRLAVGVAQAMPTTPPAAVTTGAPEAAEPFADETPAVTETQAPTPAPEPLAEAEAPALPDLHADTEVAAPSDPHAPPATPPRGGLAALLRRPFARLRAYLTASVEHQLHLQARRTAELAGAAGRADRRTEHLVAQADALLARTAAGNAQADALAVRLDHVSAHTAVLARQLEGVAGVMEGMALRLLAAERRAADQLALARQAATTGDHAVRRLDEVLAVLGPRLDELEIKVRPLIEVDAQSVAVRTADGYVMLPRSEPLFVTAVANATSGGLEPGTRRVLRALLRPGDACADVGANVGLLTVAMAFSVGDGGRVWAFEPEARVRAQLERTLHLNGLRQVALSGAAVGAAAGRLSFNQSPIIGHSSLYPLPDDEQAQARPVEVEVVTLDGVVPPGTSLAAVKIDVEGAELDVLRGMTRVAADSPDLAVVAEFGPSHLARVGVTPDAWFAAFAALGLHPRLIAEPSGRVSPVGPDDLADAESANLVFVRPGGAADGRLPR